MLLLQVGNRVKLAGESNKDSWGRPGSEEGDRLHCEEVDYEEGGSRDWEKFGCNTVVGLVEVESDSSRMMRKFAVVEKGRVSQLGEGQKERSEAVPLLLSSLL